MKWARTPTIILGIVCLILGLTPYRRVTIKYLPDGATETRRIYSLGLPSSPVAILENFETSPSRVLRPDGGETFKGASFQKSSRIEFLSWSMFLLVLAAIVFDADWRWFGRRKSLPRNQPES